MSISENRQLSVGIQTPGWPHENFPNGVTKYVANIKPVLEQMGVSITVLANFTGNCEITDSDVIDIGLRKVEKSLIKKLQRILSPRQQLDRKLTKRFQQLANISSFNDLDLVEMSDTFGHSSYLKKVSDVPIIVRLHGPWFLNGEALGVEKDNEYFDRIKREGEGIVCADGITAPSLDVLQKTRTYYQIPLSNAEVIPNPIPNVQASDIWNIESCEMNTILFVGRFDRHKGGDLIVEAFIQLKNQLQDAQLVFVGPDPGILDSSGQLVSIQKFISDKEISSDIKNSIKWVGQLSHNEIVNFRKKAMVTVVSSRYENFGTVILEALSHGCPLVVSDSGGSPEIVEHGKSGLLFQSGNFEDLAHKLYTLLTRPGYAAELGRNGLDRAINEYGTEVIASRQIAYYKQILGRAR